MTIPENTLAIMSKSEINNSFGLQATMDTLKDVEQNSFWYLYRLQRNLVKFKEFYFPKSISSTTSKIHYGDMYLDSKSNVCMNLDIDIVNQNSREKFYRSELMFTEFTLEDIASNPDIFERIPLISIDRRYIFNYKIRMENGMTTIILPKKMAYLYAKNNKIVEHKTSVVCVENKYFHRLTLHRGAINAMKGPNGEIRINNGYAGMGPYRTDGTYFAFIEFQSDKGTSSLINTCKVADNGSLEIEFYNRIKTLIENEPNDFIITFIFMTGLKEYKMKNNQMIIASNNPSRKEVTCPILVIDRSEMNSYEMPIPIENTFVLKRITDGSEINGEYEAFAPNTMNIFYPNMYKIQDNTMKPGDMYRVFYFYRDGVDLSYKNRYLYYYQYLKRRINLPYLEMAINKVYREDITDMDVTKRNAFTGVFRKLMNYNDFDYEYGTVDYITDHAGSMGPYEYKESRMHQFVNANTDNLINYVKKQNQVSDTYYLFTKKIDLSERLRNDTSDELTKVITFDEPHYLFMFNNPYDDDKELVIHIWIDGLLCMDVIHISDFGVDYLYIPQSAVTDDSYIEMEICHSFDFETVTHFENTTAVREFVITNEVGSVIPTMNDLIFIDENNSSVTYDISNFEILRRRYNHDFVARTENNSDNMIYTTVDHIKIRALNETVLHKQIRIAIRKNARYQQTNFTREGYPVVELNNYRFKHDTDFIRIYRNGRLMPKTMYMLKDNFDRYRLQMLFRVNPNDRFAVDITPNQNKLLYFIEDIPEDGIIDLSGVIDKPFDIMYYDVFVNGAKLNVRNVFRIDDMTIKLVNLKSLYHLEIYQKDRDEEYYGWTKNNITYYFKLSDLFKESFITESDKIDIMNDIIQNTIKDSNNEEFITIHPNTNEEDKNCDDDIDYNEDLRVKIFYYEELLPKRFMNPHEAQFNKEYIQTEYPEITKKYLIEGSQYAISENVNVSNTMKISEDVMYFDPDISYDTAKEVYFLGDYDSLFENKE